MSDLLDWLGDGGKAVEVEVAEARANICRKCPENRAPLWWEKTKDVIADCIRARLEVKNRLNMRVPDEDSLSMCRVCGCCIRLKVWTPLEHLNHDTERFPKECWIRRGL